MHRGFKKGNKKALDTLTYSDYKRFRKSLKAVIGGQTDSKVLYYINGATIIREDVAKKIEKIFTRHGIRPEDIWDI